MKIHTKTLASTAHKKWECSGTNLGIKERRTGGRPIPTCGTANLQGKD